MLWYLLTSQFAYVFVPDEKGPLGHLLARNALNAQCALAAAKLLPPTGHETKEYAYKIIQITI